MPGTQALQAPPSSFSSGTLGLAEILANEDYSILHSSQWAGLTLNVCATDDSLWAIIRRAGCGGLAIRMAQAPQCMISAKQEADTVFEISSPLGKHRVSIELEQLEMPVLRFTTQFTPAAPLLLPYVQRDVYPFDETDDPTAASGRVEAAQRGLNTALVYFRFDQPQFGNVLYVQNLTAINSYFTATRTTPDGAVGGIWPELGYLLPTPPQKGTPPEAPLQKGETYTLSDGMIVIRDHKQSSEANSALEFLQMLGTAYNKFGKPEVEFRDWRKRSKATLRDLAHSPKAHARYRGNDFFRPYTDAEYPDAMVQLSLISALHDYELWTNETLPLRNRFARGLGSFYDPELGTIRRYLPNVGDDKDADAVDSWYLYHPLLNLGRMALNGDKKSKKLLLDSADFAIKAARHFDYRWPIQFNVKSFDIITATRGDDVHGQTDVGGIYAYVMLQLFQLTNDKRYLDEARAAIAAALGMRFELEYQANLTAWGAAACMRLWRILGDESYLRQAYVYLASFFHNTIMWESDIENAAHFSTFLAATCLHDAPYMAIYECFDSYIAFEHLLRDSGPDLDPMAQMLISEYCRFAVHRAWFYYPDTLPKEVLATENRNGHIDRKLSFPLEDLYPSGEPQGQVGQEIYGAGAAFAFLTRSFHPVDGAHFSIYCDHFIVLNNRSEDSAVSFQLNGGAMQRALICIVPDGRRKMPKMSLLIGTEEIKASSTPDGRIEYKVPANAQLVLRWTARRTARKINKTHPPHSQPSARSQAKRRS